MPERFELEQCIRAELAELEVKISASVLSAPKSVIETKNIPPEAGEAMLGAVILKDFLAVLDTVSAENHPFRHATTAIV